MAFLQVEDLVGTIEVIVFPKTYEQYGSKLMEDEKVLLRGRVSAEEDKDAKLICANPCRRLTKSPKSSGLSFRRWKPISSRKKAAFGNRSFRRQGYRGDLCGKSARDEAAWGESDRSWGRGAFKAAGRAVWRRKRKADVSFTKPLKRKPVSIKIKNGFTDFEMLKIEVQPAAADRRNNGS